MLTREEMKLLKKGTYKNVHQEQANDKTTGEILMLVLKTMAAKHNPAENRTSQFKGEEIPNKQKTSDEMRSSRVKVEQLRDNTNYPELS